VNYPLLHISLSSFLPSAMFLLLHCLPASPNTHRQVAQWLSVAIESASLAIFSVSGMPLLPSESTQQSFSGSHHGLYVDKFCAIFCTSSTRESRSLSQHLWEGKVINMTVIFELQFRLPIKDDSTFLHKSSAAPQ
jgi:hypothetical protein